MELPRVYNLLNPADDNKLKDVCAMLADADWLWKVDTFVSSDRVDFVSLVHASPWLVTVLLDTVLFDSC